MNEESEELIHGINKTFKHELGGAYGNWVFERYTAVKIDGETLENNFLNHWGKRMTNVIKGSFAEYLTNNKKHTPSLELYVLAGIQASENSSVILYLERNVFKLETIHNGDISLDYISPHLVAEVIYWINEILPLNDNLSVALSRGLNIPVKVNMQLRVPGKWGRSDRLSSMVDDGIKDEYPQHDYFRRIPQTKSSWRSR